MADELCGEARLRALVDVLGRADLLDETVAHDGDAVGEVERFFLIVGHIKKGDAGALLYVLEFALHLLAQFEVERAERLVQQQQLRLQNQRAGNGDTLPLSAGELGRHALFKALQRHQAQHFPHAALALVLFHAAHAQAVGDVPTHVHMRKERVTLKYGIDVAFLRRQGGDVRAVQKHTAAVRRC